MIAIFAMRASDDYDESEHSQSKDTLLKWMTIGVQMKKKKKKLTSIFIYYRTHFNDSAQMERYWEKTIFERKGSPT